MTALGHYLNDGQPCLDSVFDAIQDGIIVLDRDFSIVRTNRWIENKYASQMPLIGKRCHTVFRNEKKACSACPYFASLETGKAHMEVLPYPSAQSPNEWYEISICRLEDVDGRVIGAIGHVKDITERMKAEELLKDEVTRRRILVEQSSDGIVVLRQDGKVYEANQKFSHMLGYSLEETHQLHVWDWDTQIKKEKLMEMLQSIDETGDHFETRHRRKDGTVYDVEISTNGAVYRGQKLIFCVCRDITERISEQKRIEEALLMTQFSFDKSLIGIFRTGDDARILNVNDQACKNLGYTREELCQMSILDIDASMSLADRTDLWQSMCKKGTINFETVHRRKDGTTMPVDVTSNLLEFEGKKYSLSFARDITRQKNDEVQKAIIETHLRQAQKMEALGALAGGIAHDFNNILSAIYGYSELAQLRCSENSKLRHYIDQISMSSNRAKHLVQQILAFSRQGKSEKLIVDISSVIRETLKLIRATFPATIDIKENIQPNLANLLADETQIHQVLMNLCTNAYHSMQAEGGLLEVALAPATVGTYDSSCDPILSPGKYIKLVVADTGHGMDPELMSHIFEPYFTTKKSGEGTGMGLSTVHGIVKDHGGSIKVYSQPGIGTTFQIFLPVADTASQYPTAESGGSSSGKWRIMLVDDETPILESGKAFLEDLGYEIDASISPVDAFERFKMNPDKVHLIVSDLIMPEMTGEELARAIRKIRPDIPIIFWTGYSENINADALSEIGINEVLLKPITLSHLADTLRKVLGNRPPDLAAQPQ